MNLKIAEDFKEALIKIKQLWTKSHDTDGVFRYKLDIKEQKILEGKLKFFCQLNPKRTTLRRLPQQIESLHKPFDDSVFNFKKISHTEHLLEVTFNESNFNFIINQSPLTKFHSLICPELNSGFPQKLTKETINFALIFLKSIEDTTFQIGYNSPGALASVNHLHLHLMKIEHKLFVQDVELKPINGDFHILEKIPFNGAFCYVMKEEMSTDEASSIIFDLVSMLCKENIPHNLFFNKNNNSSDQVVKTFIFVRENACIVKDYTQLNIAFCEFSGYVPVGDEILYNSLSEEKLIGKINSEIGNSYQRVLDYIKTL